MTETSRLNSFLKGGFVSIPVTDCWRSFPNDLPWAELSRSKSSYYIWSCRSDYKISHLSCSQIFWWFSFCFPLMFGLSTGLNGDFLKMLFLFGFELNQTDFFFHFNALISCILCSHCLINCLSLNIFYGYALLTHSGHIIFYIFFFVSFMS